MSVENEMYKGYKLMIEGYKEDSERGNNKMEVGIQSWLKHDPENPFNEGTSEHESFFQMKLNYSLWMSDDPSRRISMRRMLAAARDLCSHYPKNPYKFDKKIDEAEKLEAAAIEAEFKKQREEAEAAELKKEAERIVLEEARKEEEIKAEAEAREIWEKAEAEAIAAEKRKAAFLRKAVEEKRAEYKAKQAEEEKLKEHGAVDTKPSPTLLNVVPENYKHDDYDNIDYEEPKQKKGFFKRIFGRKE